MKTQVTTLLALAWLTSSVALAQTPTTSAEGPGTERMDRMPCCSIWTRIRRPKWKRS